MWWMDSNSFNEGRYKIWEDVKKALGEKKKRWRKRRLELACAIVAGVISRSVAHM